MKDTKFPNIILQDPTREIKTKDSGRLRLKPRILADYFFRYPEPGEFRFEDRSGNLSGLEVVKGIEEASATTFRFTPHPVTLTDKNALDVGAYTPSLGINTVTTLPSGLSKLSRGKFSFFPFGRENSFLVQGAARSLLPTAPGDKRTFHIRMLVDPGG